MFKPGDKIISPHGNFATVTRVEGPLHGCEVIADAGVFLYFTIDADGREAGGLASKCSYRGPIAVGETRVIPVITHRLPDYDGLS